MSILKSLESEYTRETCLQLLRRPFRQTSSHRLRLVSSSNKILRHVNSSQETVQLSRSTTNLPYTVAYCSAHKHCVPHFHIGRLINNFASNIGSFGLPQYMFQYIFVILNTTLPYLYDINVAVGFVKRSLYWKTFETKCVGFSPLYILCINVCMMSLPSRKMVKFPFFFWIYMEQMPTKNKFYSPSVQIINTRLHQTS
jgi:hypothetical protein